MRLPYRRCRKSDHSCLCRFLAHAVMAQFACILTASSMQHHYDQMRTTVTIVTEAEQLLRQAMKHTGQSFKEVLNRAILKGLANETVAADEEPFVVISKPMGLRTGLDPGRLNSLADDLEADAFLALTNQLLSRQADE